MGNYSNAKKYKLKCNITNKIYIGVSIKPINAYLTTIKTDYKLYLQKRRNYRKYYDILEKDDYVISAMAIASDSYSDMINKKYLKTN